MGSKKFNTPNIAGSEVIAGVVDLSSIVMECSTGDQMFVPSSVHECNTLIVYKLIYLHIIYCKSKVDVQYEAR